MYRLNCYCQLVQRNLSPKVLDLTVVTTYFFAVHKRRKSWEGDKFPHVRDIWPERCKWLEHEPYAVRQMKYNMYLEESTQIKLRLFELEYSFLGSG